MSCHSCRLCSSPEAPFAYDAEDVVPEIVQSLPAQKTTKNPTQVHLCLDCTINTVCECCGLVTGETFCAECAFEKAEYQYID